MRQHSIRSTDRARKRLTPVWSDPTPLPVQSTAAPLRGAPAFPVQGAAALDSRAGVLLLGSPLQTRRLRARLESWEAYGMRCFIAEDLRDAERQIATGRIEVVLYVAPLDDGIGAADVETAVDALLGNAPEGLEIIHLTLVPKDFERDRVESLYRRGVGAVFAWPDDISPLPRLLRRMLTRNRSSEPTKSLADTVRARVKVRLQKMGREIAVETVGDVAKITGRVGSMWAKLALERHATTTPGVRRVDISAVEVDPVVRSDNAIATEVRTLLETAESVDARTLGVSVQNGNVVLMGTSQPGESREILAQASVVPGVRSITDMTLPSQDVKQRDGRIAETLEHAARHAAGSRGLRVAIVKRTVVLRGVGSPKEVKRALERLRERIASSGFLRKVIDHSRVNLARA